METKVPVQWTLSTSFLIAYETLSVVLRVDEIIIQMRINIRSFNYPIIRGRYVPTFFS